MMRIAPLLVAATLVAGLQAASAQTGTAPEAKPSRMKLTLEKLKEMKAKWIANRPKLKACRAEVKARGLHGDDRWFFIEDCMTKT
jgi:hypothetical protein